jgi:hypothetical protein
MSIFRTIHIIFLFSWLLSTTAVYAQTPGRNGEPSPNVGLNSDTKDATNTEGILPGGAEPIAPAMSVPKEKTVPEEQPASATATPPPSGAPSTRVVKKTKPAHLKSFGAALSWRTNFDKDGPCGGAMFSLYYYPNYYIGLEASGFNIVSMTFTSNEYGDRDGGGAGAAIKFFPLKYKPEGLSYYVKAGGVYEMVQYVLDPVTDFKEDANYFGFEAGGGLMYTLGSTLSFGFEASFLGTIAQGEVEQFQPKAGVGPFDRAALTMKLYLMVRWNLFAWVQGPDGKFREEKHE